MKPYALKPYAQTELESIKRDAASSEGKSPEERMAIFADLMETVDAIWRHLPAEERQRRLWIADQLNRRPDPWWSGFRRDALEGFKCANSPE